jgi:hypothetical protein
MSALVYWAITAVVIIVLAGIIGRRVVYIKEDGTEGTGNWLGIFVDERQRYSLTHTQLILWSVVIISLLFAVFMARLLGGPNPSDALKIIIPPEVLGLAGISGGTAVLSTTIKSSRTDAVRRASINPETNKKNPTHFAQIFMVEEGANIDKVIDITRFQNFFLTFIAVIAYVVMAANTLAQVAVPAGLPGLSQDLLWLVGISHAAYVGGKFSEKK